MTDTADKSGKIVQEVALPYGTNAQEIEARCAETVAGWAEMSAQQQAETVALAVRFWARPVASRFDLIPNGDNAVCLRPAEKNDALGTLRQAETFATNSHDLAWRRIDDLTRYRCATNGGTLPIDGLNADLAFVRGGQADDPVQAAMLVQMAATHDAAMTALTRSARAEYVEQAKVFGNLSVKLLNAYTRQAEALAKLQRGGEQVVRHIHIDNRHGGQAIVAETFVKGGQNAEGEGQSHAAGTAGAIATLPCPDAVGGAVPIPGGERPEAMPDARRHKSGRAKG